MAVDKLEKNESSLKHQLYLKIQNKLNKLLMNEDFKYTLNWFFEPILQDESPEEIFTFKNPFKNWTLNLRWPYLHRKQKQPPILEENQLDSIPLENIEEMLNFLENTEEKMAKLPIRNRNIKLPFIDFFEDEDHFVIALELPNLDENSLDIRASPHELEIKYSNYHKVIPIGPRINPDTAVASHKGQFLEVKFQKVQKRPKSTIPIQ